jgi:hypothetical protein
MQAGKLWLTRFFLWIAVLQQQPMHRLANQNPPPFHNHAKAA